MEKEKITDITITKRGTDISEFYPISKEFPDSDRDDAVMNFCARHDIDYNPDCFEKIIIE